MAEPPSLSGASQDRSSFPVSFTDAAKPSGVPGTVAATEAVEVLVSDSSWPASSVKVTLTLMVLPTSSATSVWVLLVAFGMLLSEVPSLAIHW